MTWVKLSPRKMVYALMIFALLSLLPMLMQKGLANAYHFKSRFYVDQWQQGTKPTSLQYANALLAADYAFSVDDKNPHYLLTLAKVMEWGVFSQQEKPNIIVFNQLYLDAITLRPNWPNAYSDYAYNLAFIQKDIVQAWPYLEQALHYGPYAPEVLHQTLAIGFAYWPSLTMAQKQKVFSSAYIAASANWEMFTDLKTLALKYKLAPVVCTYFAYATPVSGEVNKWIKLDMCR
ncbi:MULTISPECIES: hypothetical protein [unclassified Shewanella]|jgi:hypothetical protein|uniref:hypothetical protein n=1 Tax=unclassified Shewanella TaxID=196818 RepID=UPI00332B62AC